MHWQRGGGGEGGGVRGKQPSLPFRNRDLSGETRKQRSDGVPCCDEAVLVVKPWAHGGVRPCGSGAVEPWSCEGVRPRGCGAVRLWGWGEGAPEVRDFPLDGGLKRGQGGLLGVGVGGGGGCLMTVKKKRRPPVRTDPSNAPAGLASIGHQLPSLNGQRQSVNRNPATQNLRRSFVGGGGDE